MDDVMFATFDECEPQYSQIPFFSGALKSIIAVGTFVTLHGGIYRIVLYDTKKKTVTMNSFIVFPGSGITHAPIFSGVKGSMLKWYIHVMVSPCLLVY